jgi:hypothetical protein
MEGFESEKNENGVHDLWSLTVIFDKISLEKSDAD